MKQLLIVSIGLGAAIAAPEANADWKSSSALECVPFSAGYMCPVDRELRDTAAASRFKNYDGATAFSIRVQGTNTIRCAVHSYSASTAWEAPSSGVSKSRNGTGAVNFTEADLTALSQFTGGYYGIYCYGDPLDSGTLDRIISYQWNEGA